MSREKEKYESMLKRILNSKIGKELYKEYRSPEYGFTEKEAIEETVFNFLTNQELTTIIEVLPEVWEDIKGYILLEVEHDILSDLKSFEERYEPSTGLRLPRLVIEFDVDKYLERLAENIVASNQREGKETIA